MNNCDSFTEITEIDRYSNVSDLTNPSCFNEEEEEEKKDETKKNDIQESDPTDIIQVTRSCQTLYAKKPQEQRTVQIAEKPPAKSCCIIS